MQTLLNDSKQNGLLHLPIPLPGDLDFSILQYADDTLVFLQADLPQLIHLKGLLHSFADSSSLRVNFDKSFMVPVNVKLDLLANAFGCSKASLPFTYLGLRLSTSKPSVADFWSLVSRCERKLRFFSSYLSEAGRLEMSNVVLSALPTFAMSTFLLAKTVIKQIDKFHKHCLWRGSDLHSRKPSKAA